MDWFIWGIGKMVSREGRINAEFVGRETKQIVDRERVDREEKRHI